MKNFSQFREETKYKTCPPGKYWDPMTNRCKIIPRGYYVGARGRLENDPDGENNDNGTNGNNGVDSGNGSSSSGGSGNGQGTNGGGS